MLVCFAHAVLAFTIVFVYAFVGFICNPPQTDWNCWGGLGTRLGGFGGCFGDVLGTCLGGCWCHLESLLECVEDIRGCNQTIE